MLPTDQLRKINEVIKTAEVAKIRTINGFIEVQCEFEEGVLTPWMPYCQPFVGGTSIFCYPRVGQGGIIMSEGGENNLNRFLPVLDTSQQFAGLGEFDFKILFENGDFIHHNSGNLTINSAAKVIVNTQDATVNADSSVTVNTDNATVNASQYSVNALTINLNGNVNISGSISAGGGMGRSAKTAVFNYPVIFQAPATANADITINGISFLGHIHPHPEGPTGTPE